MKLGDIIIPPSIIEVDYRNWMYVTYAGYRIGPIIHLCGSNNLTAVHSTNLIQISYSLLKKYKTL